MTDLDSLLSRQLTFKATYRQKLSNHLPMALTALSKLGADENTLDAFYDFYSPHLVERGAAERLGDFDSALGKEHSGRFDFFREQIFLRGQSTVLRTFVPTLNKGVAAAAFHGVIRTAYALLAKHDGELASALDAWSEAHWTHKSDSKIDIFESASALCEASLDKPDAPLIDERIQMVLANPKFQEALVKSERTPKTKKLLDFALRAYHASGGHFTALHMVTGVHAFVIVDEALQNEGLFLDATPCVNALLAAYVTIGAPNIDVEIPEPSYSFDDIKTEALNSKDDHTIKFVYSCIDLHERALLKSNANDALRFLAASKVFKS